MYHAERSVPLEHALGRGVCSLVLLFLVGCASAPAPLPRLQQQALGHEQAGVRQYERGDLAAAWRAFMQAHRLFVSMDDGQGAARNQLHAARARLAQGLAQAAWEQASAVSPALVPQARLVQAQALLALGQLQPAHDVLAQASADCPVACADRGSLLLLRGYQAWQAGRLQDALAHAEMARAWLHDQGASDRRELANAWRLIGKARHGLHDTAGALVAVQAALALDRALALPDKLARDWLLIGDIERPRDRSRAQAAYQRALDIAQAARLDDVVQQAERALQEK